VSEFWFKQDTRKMLNRLLPLLELLASQRICTAAVLIILYFLELIKQLSNNEIQL